MPKRKPPASYRAMSDRATVRYLDTLRERVARDRRPDPTAMTLEELGAYVQRLADTTNAASRQEAYRVTGDRSYLNG